MAIFEDHLKVHPEQFLFNLIEELNAENKKLQTLFYSSITTLFVQLLYNASTYVYVCLCAKSTFNPAFLPFCQKAETSVIGCRQHIDSNV